MTQRGAPIDRGQVVAPTPSLVTSARPLSTMDGTPIPFDTWRTGVSYPPAPLQKSIVWPRCNDPAATKQDPVDGIIVDFEPFGIYTPVFCVGPTFPLVEADIMRDGQDLADAQLAWALAQSLWFGTEYTDTHTPTLRNSGQDITAGATDSLAQAMAQLIDAYFAATGGLGGMVLHIPDIAITATASQWLTRLDGNLYRGPNNSIVSPGPGYPSGASTLGPNGFGPMDASGNFAATTAKELWAFITGPVEYATTPAVPVPQRPEERRHYRQNDFYVWFERMAILRFDPDRVFACKFTNPAVP